MAQSKPNPMSQSPLANLLRFSVRLRLTVPFLVVTIVVASLGIFTVTRLVSGSIEERLANQLVDSAQTATNAIVDIEREQLDRLRLMVNTIGIDDAIVQEDADQIDSLLRPLIVSEGIERTLVISNQREIIYRLDQTDEANPEALQVDDWASITRVLQNDSDELGDKFVELQQTDNATFFYTVAPVVNVENAVVGAVVIGISTEDIVQTLSNRAIAQVVLYATAGDVLASTFPVDAVVPLTLEETNDFVVQSDLSNIIDEIIVSDNLYQVLYVPLRLRQEIVGLKMVALPSDFVANRIGVSRNILTSFFVAFFLSVMAIGWGVSRSILTPLSQLLFTTRQIRSGNLNKRVELKNRDELGELGQSFDTMADALVARNRRIQKLYDSQVQETARRDAILKSIGDAVVVIDLDKTPLLRNSAAQFLIETARENPKYARELKRLLTNPEVLLEDSQLISFGRYHYSAQARRVATRDQDMGFVVVFRDITEIIELENTKDEIILQISHELRTPLSAATGYLELLGLVQEFGENSRQFYHNADKHLKELAYMINQVIEVSAILSNRFDLSLDEMDLVEIVEGLIEEQQIHFEEKQLTLHINLPESLTIIGDGRRLRQTLEHVLNNARQYTLPNGIITIDVADLPSHAQIRVSDTGVGIDEDEINLVFDRLYRGRAADAGETDSRGLGVGLFISEEIVSGHNGSIDIASRRDEGTTVTIHLPKYSNQIK